MRNQNYFVFNSATMNPCTKCVNIWSPWRLCVWRLRLAHSAIFFRLGTKDKNGNFYPPPPLSLPAFSLALEAAAKQEKWRWQRAHRWTLESVYGLILLQRVTISEANYYAYHCRNCFSRSDVGRLPLGRSIAQSVDCSHPTLLSSSFLSATNSHAIFSSFFFLVKCQREFIYLSDWRDDPMWTIPVHRTHTHSFVISHLMKWTHTHVWAVYGRSVSVEICWTSTRTQFHLLAQFQRPPNGNESKAFEFDRRWLFSTLHTPHDINMTVLRSLVRT